MQRQDKCLLDQLHLKRSLAKKDPAAGPKTFDKISHLPKCQLEKLISGKIIEKDGKACQHIFQKLYEEDIAAEFHSKLQRDSQAATRQRIVTSHEQNIELERKSGLQRDYQTIGDAVDEACGKPTQKFRVSSASAARAIFRASHQRCSERTLSLSQKVARKSVLQVPNPIEFCNDFRGLLLADHMEALKNCIPQEEMQVHASTVKVSRVEEPSAYCDLTGATQPTQSSRPQTATRASKLVRRPMTATKRASRPATASVKGVKGQGRSSEASSLYQELSEFETRVDTRTQTRQKFSKVDLQVFTDF